MAVTRMGVANPASNTSTLIFTADAAYLCSVIATNKGAAASTVRAWVVPNGSVSSADHAYMLYNVALPISNGIESHRFAVSTGDTVRVSATTADVSFSLNGIYDSSASIDAHIPLTTNVHGIADTANLATLTTTNALNTRLISLELGLGIFD
jgi:ABC-type molybdate transport system ATPase subunit